LEKVAQLFVLLLQILQKIPKVNSHPMGENSPNLVTLARIENMIFRCWLQNLWPTFILSSCSSVGAVVKQGNSGMFEAGYKEIVV
jgi:hypothetical protein